MAIDLSVNLNKIALIRNSRPGHYPDVAFHGKACLNFGAQGITAHPRPDQRHIRPDDVRALAKIIGDYPSAELNIEGNPFAEAAGNYPGLLALVDETRPHQCTLVPDNQHQATSDHGFDLTIDGPRLAPIIEYLHKIDVRVSLFMDPELDQIALARDFGADRVELYTGPFADCYLRQDQSEITANFAKYCAAAQHAHQLGLGVNAGHDLNLNNMGLFRTLPHLQEVSIGHALTVEALEMGLQNTIEAYLKICSE